MVKVSRVHNREIAKSEGSSLAISLFFFLLCSLICAGIIYLANSSTASVSKSINDVPDYPLKPEDVPEPENPQQIDPQFQDDIDAINVVYGILSRDFGNVLAGTENGVEITIAKTPKNLPYQIISYMHAYYKDPPSPGDNQWIDNFVPMVYSDDDGGTVTMTFEVTLTNMNPVNVTVTMTGTDGSKSDGNLSINQNWGLDFQTLTITVTANDNSECTYSQVYTYSVPNNAKFYIRYQKNYQFVIKNAV